MKVSAQAAEFHPRPYQVQGAGALAASANFLLADAPGLGKTAQAIMGIMIHAFAAARAEDDGAPPFEFRALVVCPAHVRETWRAEIEKVWQHLEPPEVRTIKKTAPISLADLAAQAIVICSYNGVGAVIDASYERPFDYLIFDESQALKNFGSERSRKCLPLPHSGHHLQGRRRWFLTGTPLVSKPLDVYPMLSVIYTHGWGRPFYTQPDFSARFCVYRTIEEGFRNRHGEWEPREVFICPKNVDELQKWLRPIMLRREKLDVLTELPPISHMELRVTLDRAGNTAAADAHAQGGYEAAANFTLKDEQSLLGDRPPLAEALQKLGLAKATASVDHINALREAGEDVLVLAHYHSTADALGKALGVPVVDGRVPADHRRDVILAALEKGKAVVAGITAISTGLNLQAASSVVFVEPSPGRPDQISQAVERAWRMGQTRPVSVFVLIAEGAAVDKAVWGSLHRLNTGVEKVMGGI